MDSVLSWKAPGHLIDNYTAYLSGFDPENSPIAIINFGSWNIRKLIENNEKTNYIRYIDMLFERLQDEMRDKFTPEGEELCIFKCSSLLFNHRPL